MMKNRRERTKLLCEECGIEIDVGVHKVDGSILCAECVFYVDDGDLEDYQTNRFEL